MKVKSLLVMSLATLALVACSKDEEVVVPQNGSLVINLTSLEAQTKATEAGIGEESTLQDVLVYAFDANGNMYSTPQSAVVSSEKSQATLTWQLPVGQYTLAAVSAKAQFSNVTAATLPQQVIHLADNSRSKFVMYGSKSVNIIAGSNDNVQIDVARVLSGIQLNNIKTAFTNTVPPAFINATATLKSIKIVGSKVSAQLGGSAVDNAEKTTEDDMTRAKFESENAVTITTSDMSAKAFTTAARAYACPGSADRVTICVNYAGIGDKYYSINLTSLAANTMYGLEVTITGIGSDKEDEPTPVGNGDFTIKAQDWTTGTVISGNPEY